jgi:hypothetical protein
MRTLITPKYVIGAFGQSQGLGIFVHFPAVTRRTWQLSDSIQSIRVCKKTGFCSQSKNISAIFWLAHGKKKLTPSISELAFAD